jgi:ankyrin repeat protein
MLNIPFTKVVSRLIHALLVTIMVANVAGCKNASEDELATANEGHSKNDQLVLRAKKAILNLDLNQLMILSDKVDVNWPLPDKSSLLAWAVETQDPRFVNLLLEKGALVHRPNQNLFSPIIVACRYGNSNIINALLDQGADVSRVISDGTSALHLCAGSASVQDLARMVSHGADISVENDDGQTPLMFAANAGNLDNLIYLVNAGADINKQTKQGFSPLFFAIKSHDLATVKGAIASGADVLARADDGTTAAQLAMYTHNFTFLTWFVGELDSLMTPAAAKGVLTAFDREGYQLLHGAVKANQAELVSILLAQGANATRVSEPSKLKWRYEANFKSEEYLPPQLTPIEIAENNEFKAIATLLRNAS